MDKESIIYDLTNISDSELRHILSQVMLDRCNGLWFGGDLIRNGSDVHDQILFTAIWALLNK